MRIFAFLFSVEVFLKTNAKLVAESEWYVVVIDDDDSM